jgi:PAS domain S-box-containing protein
MGNLGSPHLSYLRPWTSSNWDSVLSMVSGEFVSVRSLAGEHLFTTASVTRILGYTAAEFSAFPYEAFVHSEDVVSVTSRQRDALAGLGPGTCIHRARHKDGRWLWIEAGQYRIERSVGDVMLLVGRDVTRTVGELHELRSALETAEAERRLQREFLASISHELRTPLNAVLGYAELLADDAQLSPVQAERLECIRDAGSALLALVNETLELTVADLKEATVRPRPMAVGELVHRSVRLARGLPFARGTEIVATVGPTLPRWIVADEDRLRQVLLNLLSNAVRATANGTVTLSVEQVDESGPRRTLLFTVSDTGIGISTGQQETLFEPLPHFESSSDAIIWGTGLGLAISRRLVRDMGGEIGFTSEKGRGSTFWFRVPVRECPDGRESFLPQGRRKVRILLAEDVRVTRDLGATILRDGGYEVDAVNDGHAALGAARSGRYDLIVMDLQMPGIDGLAATKLIRRLTGRAGQVPVLALTGRASRETLSEFQHAGVTAWLRKPVGRDVLLRTVGEVLAGTAVLSRGDGDDEEPGRRVAAPHPASGLLGLAAGMNGNEVADLIAEWAQVVAEKADRLASAAHAGELGKVRQEAHDLAAMAGTLGLDEISGIAAQLETLGDDPDLGEVRRLAAVLERAAPTQLARVCSRDAASKPADWEGDGQTRFTPAMSQPGLEAASPESAYGIR